VPTLFYWATYAAIWLLPATGFALAVRDKHRPMLWANLVMAIATLATNKPYLGWQQHTWDPVLLGALLLATAMVVRRWLSRGPDGTAADSHRSLWWRASIDRRSTCWPRSRSRRSQARRACRTRRPRSNPVGAVDRAAVAAARTFES
jgi:hypothetical protein